MNSVVFGLSRIINKNMIQGLSFKTLSIGLSFVFLTACTPQFNRKVAAKKTTSRAADAVTVRRGTVMDPHVAGGGAEGSSASFRVTGVNVGFIDKKVGATPGNTTKFRPGIPGQLNQ
jgi:hypothetical protein